MLNNLKNKTMTITKNFIIAMFREGNTANEIIEILIDNYPHLDIVKLSIGVNKIATEYNF